MIPVHTGCGYCGPTETSRTPMSSPSCVGGGSTDGSQIDFLGLSRTPTCCCVLTELLKCVKTRWKRRTGRALWNMTQGGTLPAPTPLPPGVMRKIDHVHSINGSLRHNQSVKQEGVCAVRWLARQLLSAAVFPSLVTNNAAALLTAGKQRRDYFDKKGPGRLKPKEQKKKNPKTKHQLFGASGSVFAHIVSAVNPQRLWRHLPFIGFPFTLSPPSLSACPLPPSPVTRRLAVTRRSLIFVADALRCAAQWRLYSRSWNGPVFSPPSKSHFSPRKSSTESSEVPGKR